MLANIHAVGAHLLDQLDASQTDNDGEDGRSRDRSESYPTLSSSAASLVCPLDLHTSDANDGASSDTVTAPIDDSPSPPSPAAPRTPTDRGRSCRRSRDDDWSPSLPVSMLNVFRTFASTEVTIPSRDYERNSDRKRSASEAGDSEHRSKRQRRSGGDGEHPVPFPATGPLEMFEHEFQLADSDNVEPQDVSGSSDNASIADDPSPPQGSADENMSSLGFPVSWVRPAGQFSQQPAMLHEERGSEHSTSFLGQGSDHELHCASHLLPSLPCDVPSGFLSAQIDSSSLPSGYILEDTRVSAFGYNSRHDGLLRTDSIASIADSTVPAACYDIQTSAPAIPNLEIFTCQEDSFPRANQLYEIYAPASPHNVAESTPSDATYYFPAPQRPHMQPTSSIESPPSPLVISQEQAHTLPSSPDDASRTYAAVYDDIPATPEHEASFFLTPAQQLQQQLLTSVYPDAPYSKMKHHTHSCHLCDRAFDKPNGLALHIRWHHKHGERGQVSPSSTRPLRRASTESAIAPSPVCVLPTNTPGSVQPQYVVVTAMVDGRPAPVLAPLSMLPLELLVSLGVLNSSSQFQVL